MKKTQISRYGFRFEPNFHLNSYREMPQNVAGKALSLEMMEKNSKPSTLNSKPEANLWEWQVEVGTAQFLEMIQSQSNGFSHCM